MITRKAIFLLFFSLFIVSGASAQNADSLLNLYDNHPEKILITAHRAGHLNVPENSLAAVDEAVKAGATFIEVDVRETKDGVMILSHDKTLDRTTTGSGNIADYTYAELQQFNLKHNGVATIYKIPTFKEMLAYAKGRILVDIDFKPDGVEAVERAYNIIEEVGVEQQVLMFLYDYTQMPALLKINPQIKVMPRAYNDDQLQKIIDMGLAGIVHIDPSFEHSPLLKSTAEKNMRIWINTLGEVDSQSSDNKKVYADFLKKFKYASVIQTDYPERLLAVIRSLEN